MDGTAAGMRSYLDHNASSPLRPEAAAAMARVLALPGNPSSVHAEGRAARAALETARDEVAALVGATAKAVLFTGGGTEANNAVLSPSFRRYGGPDATLLLVGATEHPSVLSGHRFPAAAVEAIPVDRNGIVDLDWLAARLDREPGRRALVSVQLANNETGVLQPVAEAARLVHGRGGLLHTDAVQAAGKVDVDIVSLGADAMTLSAHKLGGPKGAGAIVFATDHFEIGDRLIRGGGQERGARAGTENVAAIAGFGAAAAAAGAAAPVERSRMLALRRRGEAAVRTAAGDAAIFAAEASRLPNTFAFALPAIRAETALIAFDLDGVALSSGSACSSGKVRRSHVLDAMGVAPGLAESALRVSFGWSSSEEDAIRFAEACQRLVGSLYKRRADAA